MRVMCIIPGLVLAWFTGFCQVNTDTIASKSSDQGSTSENKLTCDIEQFEVLSGKSPGIQPFQADHSVHLKANQNFFRIVLSVPRGSAEQTIWYAYQMIGFEDYELVQQNRSIRYTNVPGGNFTFQYRVSSDQLNWSAPKTLSIHINTVFYKTWWYWTFIALCIAFIIYRYYHFRMTRQKLILELQSKTTSLEKEKTRIQYETLKQQLNPHFLFNSLTSLRSLIRIDQKLATHFLDGLSKSYRYLLRSGDTDLVTLGDELNFVNTYVELQQTRFRSGFVVNVDVPETYLSRMIAPVAIQNLLENAIKHNTTSEEQPLQVDILIEHDYVVVQNNLQRYRQVETSNKRGLAGLKSLYRYHTSLPIILLEDETHFIVKIPLL
jgi:hypothetical protein